MGVLTVIFEFNDKPLFMMKNNFERRRSVILYCMWDILFNNAITSFFLVGNTVS